MSDITVLSPVAINQTKAHAVAPRLASLDRITLGILNNNKPNSLALQELVVERLGERYTLAAVVTTQKPSAAVGAEGLDVYAQEVDAVITAIGD